MKIFAADLRRCMRIGTGFVKGHAFSGVPSKPAVGLLGCGGVPTRCRQDWALAPENAPGPEGQFIVRQ